jgi:hypothetical protein
MTAAWQRKWQEAENLADDFSRRISDVSARGLLNHHLADWCSRVCAAEVLRASKGSDRHLQPLSPGPDGERDFFRASEAGVRWLADRLAGLKPIEDDATALQAALVGRTVAALTNGVVFGGNAVTMAVLAITCGDDTPTASWAERCRVNATMAGVPVPPPPERRPESGDLDDLSDDEFIKSMPEYTDAARRDVAIHRAARGLVEDAFHGTVEGTLDQHLASVHPHPDAETIVRVLLKCQNLVNGVLGRAIVANESGDAVPKDTARRREDAVFAAIDALPEGDRNADPVGQHVRAFTINSLRTAIRYERFATPVPDSTSGKLATSPHARRYLHDYLSMLARIAPSLTDALGGRTRLLREVERAYEDVRQRMAAHPIYVEGL